MQTKSRKSRKMTNSERFFGMTSSKNQHFSNFQFFMNCFNFLVTLQDPIINCYKKVIWELSTRVHSVKNHENTNNRESTIFKPLWTLIKSLKFFKILTKRSQHYVDYGKFTFKWSIFSFSTQQTLKNAILWQNCSKWL